jgi:hypothetical protein
MTDKMKETKINKLTFFSGNLVGTWMGNTILAGFWDISSRAVMFVVNSSPSVPTAQQLYRGYLYPLLSPLLLSLLHLLDVSRSQYYDGESIQELDGYFVGLAGTDGTL